MRVINLMKMVRAINSGNELEASRKKTVREHRTHVEAHKFVMARRN